MTDTSPPPESPPREPSSSESPSVDDTGKPGELGTLARVIRRRTTDLVAIAILVVAGLAFAGRLSRWLGTTPADAVFVPNETAELPWNEPGRPVSFEFGRADFVLHRERIEGDTEHAVARLVERTATLAAGTPAPDTPPDDAEQRLVTSAARLVPSRTGDDGSWSVHVSLLPMPTAIGLRRPAGVDAAAPSGEGDDEVRRAVAWGLLLGGAREWTAFWFERRSAGASRPAGSLVVLPPGAEPTVTILDAGGLGLAGFRGAGDAASWRAFFDEAYASRDGRRTRAEWTRWGDVLAARYAFDDGLVVDVRFTAAEGELDGLLTIARTASHPGANGNDGREP